MPLLQQVRSHCKSSHIAVGSCNILYKNIREIIKTSYCSKNRCPTYGFIDFPLVLQDVIDVDIDHQNYTIDFSALDIATGCDTYKIQGEACVRFETEINEYQNYVFVENEEDEMEMINQYTELKGGELGRVFKNGRFFINSFPSAKSQINDYRIRCSNIVISRRTEFIPADLESNIKVLLPIS